MTKACQHSDWDGFGHWTTEHVGTSEVESGQVECLWCPATGTATIVWSDNDHSATYIDWK